MKKLFLILTLFFLIILVSFRIFFGIFVIQPIGALPKGATIVYWRFDLNLPFIASADGLLDASGQGISLMGRGLMLAGLAEPIIKREIIRFGYNETLYLWSTEGKKYEK